MSRSRISHQEAQYCHHSLHLLRLILDHTFLPSPEGIEGREPQEVSALDPLHAPPSYSVFHLQRFWICRGAADPHVTFAHPTGHHLDSGRQYAQIAQVT